MFAKAAAPASWLQKVHSFESSFKGSAPLQWCIEHDEVPVFATVVYLFFVFHGPTVMRDRNPLGLRNAFRAWNLLLTVFSMVGTSRLVPHLLRALTTKGFKWTVCTDPKDWYMNGSGGLWMSLFIYSKIPELVDTVFLVLQKKPVIFLHWFHHVTVMLYCWHAYVNRIGPGIWFGGINYAVHSVMYLYYFLATYNRQSKLARRITTLMQMPITVVQILQMVAGSYVTVMGAVWMRKEGPNKCRVEPSNSRLGLAMYLAYFALFVMFFYEKYISKSLKKPGATMTICGVDTKTGDQAGMFRETAEDAALDKRVSKKTA